MAKSTHDALPDERNKDVQVYINGEFFHRDEAKISVFDSGYLVGDGVWEGIRLTNGTFAFLELHLDRLLEGAKAIGLDIGKSKTQLSDMLYQTVQKNDMYDNVHVRLMVTRGNKKTPSQDPRLTITAPNIVIIAEHKAANPEVTKTGIKLFTSSTRRPPPDSLDAKLNCHSKLHEVIALIQALNAGADEALMLDVNGAVATCNATNFFIVTRGEVWTSTGQHCLNGITRRMVIELCKANTVPVYEKDFSLTNVYSADEAFVTGTFGSLTPVTEVDGRTIGTGQPGGVTARLTKLYKAAIAEIVSQ
jgi:branched-chain amino acid aminotransferase